VSAQDEPRAKMGEQPAHPRIIDMKQAMVDAAGPLPWRIEPLAMDGSVTLLVGRRGEHKTFLGVFAAAATSSGRAVAGLKPAQGPALYLDIENGRLRMARRFSTVGLPADAFLVANGAGLRLPQHASLIRSLVEETKARLLVLDSLRRFAPAMKENESDTAAPVMAVLAELAQALNVAVVLIHHRSTKPGAPDVRGSSALEDQADMVWVLERLPDDPESATRRRLRCTKMRDDVEPEPLWLSFEQAGDYLTLGGAEPFGGGHNEETRARRRGEVLAALSVDEPRSGHGIADETGIPKTTTQRILEELEERELATRTDAGWLRGPVAHPMEGKTGRATPEDEQIPLDIGDYGPPGGGPAQNGAGGSGPPPDLDEMGRREPEEEGAERPSESDAHGYAARYRERRAEGSWEAR
jgi:hypothetical protein